MQSTGGPYTLSGTIGQPDAGRVAAGTVRVEGGFWGIAVQQLGFPALQISQSGTNHTLSWLSTETNFVVQQSLNLAAPTTWTDVGLADTIGGLTNSLTQPVPAAELKRFYRLRRP